MKEERKANLGGLEVKKRGWSRDKKREKKEKRSFWMKVLYSINGEINISKSLSMLLPL